ncbi:hypothetical protein [Stenotrophomonas sp. Ker107b]
MPATDQQFDLVAIGWSEKSARMNTKRPGPVSLLSAGGYLFASCEVAFVSTVRSAARNHYFQVGLCSGLKICITQACVEAANDAHGRMTNELHQVLGL